MSEEIKAAHNFTKELCQGNRAAEEFCNLWYAYCHGIDDIIDLKEDGRPTMSNEKILEVFATAALMYNCKFYTDHRPHLFPIVIAVTNLYADSVLWERSPAAHLRKIADVLRCCGDEMLLMVAIIIGGWSHMRKMSPRIRETDYRLQHDENDNPI
jgi:hypothetical protein